jgi:histidinol-phosphate/aromatic aminotransferase/cobyric acid decarboxylase-like protein
VLIRSLGVHHATRSYVRITIGTREQNLRCVTALERVLSRKRSRVYAPLSSSDAE